MIQQIATTTKKLPNGQEIDLIFGLSDDQKVYTWDWKTGAWKLNAKEQEENPLM